MAHQTLLSDIAYVFDRQVLLVLRMEDAEGGREISLLSLNFPFR